MSWTIVWQYAFICFIYLHACHHVAQCVCSNVQGMQKPFIPETTQFRRLYVNIDTQLSCALLAKSAKGFSVFPTYVITYALWSIEQHLSCMRGPRVVLLSRN